MTADDDIPRLVWNGWHHGRLSTLEIATKMRDDGYRLTEAQVEQHLNRLLDARYRMRIDAAAALDSAASAR